MTSVAVKCHSTELMSKRCIALSKCTLTLLFSVLDGSLYVITPIDPLFLILPYLTKFSQKVREALKPVQREMKVVSDSPGLVDFARGV